MKENCLPHLCEKLSAFPARYLSMHDPCLMVQKNISVVLLVLRSNVVVCGGHNTLVKVNETVQGPSQLFCLFKWALSVPLLAHEYSRAAGTRLGRIDTINTTGKNQL